MPVVDNSGCTTEADKRYHALLLRLAAENVEVILQWSLGHYGLYGNVEADRLAKAGALMVQFENCLSLTPVKQDIKSLFKTSLRLKAIEKRRERDGPPCLTLRTESL